MLGLYGCSLWTWSAWDRYRLGWMGNNNQYEISARGQNGITEVNGDLDATNPNHAGIYTLRDFVTTGDALRIKLPFVNESTEYPEWIWVENHQGYDNNGCEFDRWQYDNGDHTCIESMTAGMMLYIQINNERRVAEESNLLYTQDFFADYTRPLLANGHWDMQYPTEYVPNNCVSFDTVRPFIRYLENPLTGANDQDNYTYDKDGDNLIQRSDQLSIWTEKTSDGSLHRHLYSLGHTSHVFTLQGNHKIGMGTNPSSATQINMVGENAPYAPAKNLRHTYLNGVSIEMIEQCSNGDIRVRIRFDDVDVENDARWCSPDIRLNKIIDDGYSLNLKKNRTLLLDQGLNATKMDWPIQFNGQSIFTSPTAFIVQPEVRMHIDTSARLVLENASRFHLRDASACVVEDDGIIEVKSGTVFRMDDCALLEINGSGKLIVRSGAELRISPNATLAFQNGLQNLVLEDNVTIQPGYANPQTLINATLSNVQITGSVTWNGWNKNVNGTVTIQPGATLSIESSVLHFINKNSGVIIQPEGRLIVDNSILTNSSCNSVEMWPGIQVWGNANADQYLNHGGYSQGYLELKNGATIENAVCAVALWHPGHWSTTGGIVFADSAFFVNNAKAVHALNYAHQFSNGGGEMAYNSSFRNCTFTVDNDYLGTETFERHVHLYDISSLEFIGCHFSVDPEATGVSPWRCAIQADDAGFTATALCEDPNSYMTPQACPDEYLVRCSFTGFHNAVYANNSGGSARTFTVSDAVFTGNDCGVRAENTGLATVIRNSFALGCGEDCAFGVYAQNTANHCIEENDFAPATGFMGATYGVGLFDCGGANDVYRNDFEGLTCGNLAVGVNTAKTEGLHGIVAQGLTYTCNTNTSNTVDFCVLKDENGGGSIRAQQGSSTLPAGNTFDASGYHFYNDGDDTVDYYYNGIATGQTPNISKIYRVNRISTNSTNPCLSHYGGGTVVKSPEEKAQLEDDFHSAQEDIDLLVSLYKRRLAGGGTADELADLRAQIAQRVHDRSLAVGDIARSILNDIVTDHRELRTWLRNMGDLASDRLAIASYVQEGDFDGAFSLAQTLPSLYGLEGDELSDHANHLRLLGLHRALRQSGRTTTQLTDDERLMVEDIARAGYPYSGSLAAALLETGGLRGDDRSFCPELPRIADRGRGETGTEEREASDLKVTVTPNPASSQVTVEYALPEGSSHATLSVVNTLGEKFLELGLEGNRGSMVVDLHELPASVYFFVITDQSGRTSSSKIAKK